MKRNCRELFQNIKRDISGIYRNNLNKDSLLKNYDITFTIENILILKINNDHIYLKIYN